MCQYSKFTKETLFLMVRVWVMFGSNYNIFITATERIGQMK